MFSGLDSALQIGLLFSVPALAVAFSFRVIGFPDLTPDGSFVLGAAVGAVALTSGIPVLFALLAALACGALAGVATALIHLHLHISKLLSGIMVMTMLYSVALRVMGTSNISLLNIDTFFSHLMLNEQPWPIIGAALPVLVTGLTCYALLMTERGIVLRAAGDNAGALDLRGIQIGPQYVLGLALSNAVAAGAGFIVAQYQGFVDVSMGAGLVIVCLAALVIGESVLRPDRLALLVAAPVLGMCIYQALVSFALGLGLEPANLKIATAVLALLFVGMDRLRFSRRGFLSRQIGNHSV